MNKSIVLVLLVLLLGCVTSQPVSQTKQTFTFDYTPKATAQSGSIPMVVAILQPYYARSFQLVGNELFGNFRNALASDIEELIIAKGFTIKGPYNGYDEMVFEDKKRADMAIQIEIIPQFTAAEGGWKSNLSLLGSSNTTYSYSGKVSLVGKINLSGIEPLTHEKIWAKSVSIPNVENVQIQTSNTYTRPLLEHELYKDPGVYNAVGKALDTQYQGLMDKIAAHFNADEFLTLKNQIKELKAKKGF